MKSSASLEYIALLFTKSQCMSLLSIATHLGLGCEWFEKVARDRLSDRWASEEKRNLQTKGCTQIICIGYFVSDY